MCTIPVRLGGSMKSRRVVVVGRQLVLYHLFPWTCGSQPEEANSRHQVAAEDHPSAAGGHMLSPSRRSDDESLSVDRLAHPRRGGKPEFKLERYPPLMERFVR